MKEDFLHYLWRFQKLGNLPLVTTDGVAVRVIHPGTPNAGSGPDFCQAKLWIGDTLWAGDVELHLKASSWFHHRHHMDAQYDAVVLHVVWKYDTEVCYPSGRLMPCLELSRCIPSDQLKRYDAMFQKIPQWIPCENSFSRFPHFKWELWKERLYFERLEEKTQLIHRLLKANKNDWECTLFQMLAKNFGLNRNGNSSLRWAQHLPFSMLRKNFSDPEALEALFFGISGLLEGDLEVPYKQKMRVRYDYLKHKFGFRELSGMCVQFSRLRPANFPTIRLSQLAQLYFRQPRPFDALVNSATTANLNWIRQVGVSPFWQTHYSFEKESSKRSKLLSRSFFELLLINTLIPIRFAYTQLQPHSKNDWVISWISKLSAERNSVSEGFAKLGVKLHSALDSQALLQLKNHYCDKKRCLRCATGFYLFDFSS